MFIPIKDIKPNIKLVELTWQLRSFSPISHTETRITKSQLLDKDVDFYLQFIQFVDYEKTLNLVGIIQDIMYMK